LEYCGPRRRALPLEGLLWPLFQRTLARIGPIGNRTLARIKFPLARTPRYWFAHAPRAGYWLMRAVRQVALHARRVTGGAEFNTPLNTRFNTEYTLARSNQ